MDLILYRISSQKYGIQPKQNAFILKSVDNLLKTMPDSSFFCFLSLQICHQDRHTEDDLPGELQGKCSVRIGAHLVKSQLVKLLTSCTVRFICDNFDCYPHFRCKSFWIRFILSPWSAIGCQVTSSLSPFHYFWRIAQWFPTFFSSHTPYVLR